MAVSIPLTEMVEDTVKSLGYDLVSAERLPRGIIRITIDKEGGITLDDCELVSNQINAVLTVENVDYNRLEVSSPGLDRPLRTPKDFERFAGSLVHIELFSPLKAEGLPDNGRRRLDGYLLSVEGEIQNPTISLKLVSDLPSKTPSHKHKTAQSSKKDVSEQMIVVKFPFNSIEKACLIPELNFKGTK